MAIASMAPKTICHLSGLHLEGWKEWPMVETRDFSTFQKLGHWNLKRAPRKRKKPINFGFHVNFRRCNMFKYPLGGGDLAP